jgi:predicted O-linked N-acetylglucosamine transferase (SPINDLY family)
LRFVPNSRLLLGNVELDSACNRDYVAQRFSQRGIAADRIEFRGRADHRTFLEYYNAFDVALDAFPYNGGTTTMEAIWQGLPVITYIGDRWASRTSASILAGTRMTEFVATSVDGYVRTAVDLACDPQVAERLRSLRHSMRDSLDECPSCDTWALARAMEALYQQIYDKRLAN